VAALEQARLAKKKKRGHMNRIAGLALVALGLFVLNQAAAAQSNCKDAKGSFVEVFSGGSSTSGTLSNGGWLNGATVSVFNSSTFPTAAPTQVTFGSTFTLTTGQGELKGARMYLFDFLALKAVSMVLIDPATSSGLFAGATGMISMTANNISSGPPPVTFQQEIAGQICLAR
jgi:hypothetical protein